jgi:galactose mutarotase-like enzyme
MAAETASKLEVKKQVYGKTADGKQVDLYTMTNANGIEANVMTLGATLTTVKTPDRDALKRPLPTGRPPTTGRSRLLQSSPSWPELVSVPIR